MIYSLDFEVTTASAAAYIHYESDSFVRGPENGSYLAGHESSKITMDIYAKVKYNRPDELVRTMVVHLPSGMQHRHNNYKE